MCLLKNNLQCNPGADFLAECDGNLLRILELALVIIDVAAELQSTTKTDFTAKRELTSMIVSRERMCDAADRLLKASNTSLIKRTDLCMRSMTQKHNGHLSESFNCRNFFRRDTIS